MWRKRRRVCPRSSSSTSRSPLGAFTSCDLAAISRLSCDTNRSPSIATLSSASISRTPLFCSCFTPCDLAAHPSSSRDATRTARPSTPRPSLATRISADLPSSSCDATCISFPARSFQTRRIASLRSRFAPGLEVAASKMRRQSASSRPSSVRMW